jgi:hypothetical protein
MLEATTPDEVNRGVALINESMQTVYGVLEEFDLSNFTSRVSNWAGRANGCTAENGYAHPGDCSSYHKSNDEYFTGSKHVGDGDGNFAQAPVHSEYVNPYPLH